MVMPLQEAKLSTNLRLRFRTRQDNGLLFLAAGRTDYCLLSVDDGRIKLQFKINEHFTEVSRSYITFYLRPMKMTANQCLSTEFITKMQILK